MYLRKKVQIKRLQQKIAIATILYLCEITFAASDLNTEFICIVEAIYGSGLMGCQTFTFRVLKK